MCKTIDQFKSIATVCEIVWGVRIVMPGQEFWQGDLHTVPVSKVVDMAVSLSNRFNNSHIVVHMGTPKELYVRRVYQAGDIVKDNFDAPKQLIDMASDRSVAYTAWRNL